MTDITNVTFKTIALGGSKKKYNNKDDQSILTQNHRTQPYYLVLFFPLLLSFIKKDLTLQNKLQQEKPNKTSHWYQWDSPPLFF